MFEKSSDLAILLLVAGLALCLAMPGASSAAPKKPLATFTDAADPALPPDFRVQGEYVGEIAGGGKLGCQVISLGQGAFQAVVYPGGLPGAGWDGRNKILMDGTLEGDKALFQPSEGNRKYLAQKAQEFSAVVHFPPEGQKPYTAQIAGQTMTGKTDDGKAFTLKRTVRQSPTLGAKPPQGATVLFDGSNMDEWRNARLDEKTRLLNTDGKDIYTKRKFNNYQMHVEFLLPYRPDARGQKRGNSGFYQIDLYEVQILDSFGLEGKNNECGGIYSLKNSDVNMCLPPLTWQTFDVDFTNAVADENGKKVKNAVITVKLNGVPIHTCYSIPGKTGGSRNEPEGTPGAVKLQGHGNPLQFRNIWVLEK